MCQKGDLINFQISELKKILPVVLNVKYSIIYHVHNVNPLLYAY